MGLFSAFRASSAYENALKMYGVDPYALGPDINTKVCSYANQVYERITSRWPEDRGQNTLDACVRNAAATTAFCTLGPTKFREAGGDYDGMVERLEITARDWREEGPEAQVDTMIIKTLNDAGLLSDDFADCFNALL